MADELDEEREEQADASGPTSGDPADVREPN
jgi:hypothetical protein